MSDDNTQTTVSEETLASIVDAAQNISIDSTEMRHNLVAIAEALQSMIQRAGIKFGSLDDSQMWEIGEYPDITTKRIGIRRVYDGWMIGIEETQLIPEYHDGSNLIGHTDPFKDSAFTNGAACIIPFSKASRYSVENAIERLPAFIDEYCTQLKRMHIRYADLRKKAEIIRKVFEESEV